MKKSLILFAVLLFNNVLAQKATTFSAYETLEDVKSIQVDNNLCILLYPTNFFGIHIKGDKSLKEVIKWDFEDSVLKLYTTEENTLASNAEITLYVKDFKELRLTGNASVQTERKVITEFFVLYSRDNSTYGFPLECKDFSLVSSGASSGYIDVIAKNVRLNAKNDASTSIKVQATQINIEQTDNSILTLRGKTEGLNAVINKKARLTAWALKAKNVYLLSFNTEDTDIHVDNRLKINAQGNGKIFVNGNPKKIDTIAVNRKTKIFYNTQ